MVWGGISTKGVTQLKRVEGIMDKKMYHSILVYHAIPEGKRLLGKGFVFQEDNDPKHSSNYCRNYLATKEKSGRLISRITHSLLLIPQLVYFWDLYVILSFLQIFREQVEFYVNAIYY
jgi:hypothetical protein